MAEIIAFASKEELRRQALDKLGAKITCHLAGVFYEKNILDVPVQGLVKKMCEIMIRDGFNQEPDILVRIGEMPEAMAAITNTFIATLIQNGYLPESFTLD
jgi:hypothetical protein